MKKLFVAFVALVSMAFVACGPSKLEIQEMSTNCDVSVEVGKVLNDSISLMYGNVFRLNSKQVLGDDMFPLLVSTRDPMEFEKLTATNIVHDEDEFLQYLRRAVPDMMTIGLVIDKSATYEIGFDEAEVVSKLRKIFEKIEGGSLILFHSDENGELTSMKKLY